MEKGQGILQTVPGKWTCQHMLRSQRPLTQVMCYDMLKALNMFNPCQVKVCIMLVSELRRFSHLMAFWTLSSPRQGKRSHDFGDLLLTAVSWSCDIETNWKSECVFLQGLHLECSTQGKMSKNVQRPTDQLWYTLVMCFVLFFVSSCCVNICSTFLLISLWKFPDWMWMFLRRGWAA